GAQLVTTFPVRGELPQELALGGVQMLLIGQMQRPAHLLERLAAGAGRGHGQGGGNRERRKEQVALLRTQLVVQFKGELSVAGYDGSVGWVGRRMGAGVQRPKAASETGSDQGKGQQPFTSHGISSSRCP